MFVDIVVAALLQVGVVVDGFVFVFLVVAVVVVDEDGVALFQTLLPEEEEDVFEEGFVELGITDDFVVVAWFVVILVEDGGRPDGHAALFAVDGVDFVVGVPRGTLKVPGYPPVLAAFAAIHCCCCLCCCA